MKICVKEGAGAGEFGQRVSRDTGPLKQKLLSENVIVIGSTSQKWGLYPIQYPFPNISTYAL